MSINRFGGIMLMVRNIRDLVAAVKPREIDVEAHHHTARNFGSAASEDLHFKTTDHPSQGK